MGVRDVIILIHAAGMEKSDLSFRSKVTEGRIGKTLINWNSPLRNQIFIFPGTEVLKDATKCKEWNS